jgi:hypothetical protein
MPGSRESEILDLLDGGGMHILDLEEQASRGWHSQRVASRRRIDKLLADGWIDVDAHGIVRRWRGT